MPRAYFVEFKAKAVHQIVEMVRLESCSLQRTYEKSRRTPCEVPRILFLGICLVFHYFPGLIVFPQRVLNLGRDAVSQALMEPFLFAPIHPLKRGVLLNLLGPFPEPPIQSNGSNPGTLQDPPEHPETPHIAGSTLERVLQSGQNNPHYKTSPGIPPA